MLDTYRKVTWKTEFREVKAEKGAEMGDYWELVVSARPSTMSLGNRPLIVNGSAISLL